MTETDPPGTEQRSKAKSRRIRASLFWTFTGAFLATLVAAIVLQWIVLAAVLRPAARSWRAATRTAYAQAVASAVGRSLERGTTDIDALLHRFEPRRGGVLILFRESGGAIRASLGPDSLPPPFRALLKEADQGFIRRHLVGSAPVYVRGAPKGEVQILRIAPERLPWPEGTPRPGLLFVPFVAIIAGAAGLILFLGIVRRISQLEAAVDRVAAGELDARVPNVGADEIGRLGESFNAMAGRLQESRERLMESDRQRRRFLADVTHDLATPLTSIRGYAETLLDPGIPKTDEERGMYIRFIHEEALRMNDLVNDLLDLARVESGSVPLERERIDLSDLVRSQTERMRGAFAQVGLSVEGPSLGSRMEIDGDRRRLEQIVSNLLSNALQHAPSGRKVRIAVEPDDSGVRLVIEDDGPGFAPEDIPFVFDRFYRGNPARPAGGTGLGLAIVRGIARAHGGEAIAENRREGGARITVRIPTTNP